MKVTECLNVEHGVFLRQLDYLEELYRTGAPESVLGAVLQTIARAVEAHAGQEEHGLYPAIEEVFGPQFPPLQVMELEHQEIDRIVEATRAATFPRGMILRFLEVLRGHIQKEMNVLFPMAEEGVPVERLEALARKCAEEGHGIAGNQAKASHSCGGGKCSG